MRSRLLGLLVLAVVALPTTVSSGPYSPPRAAHGAGVIRPGTTVVFNAVAVMSPLLIPCPATGCLDAAGHVTIRSQEGHLWRAQVTCLAVSGNEAFMGLAVLEGDLLFHAAAYARQADRRELGPVARNRFALLRGVEFNCVSERVRSVLRTHAQHLIGIVHVSHACEYCD